MDGPAFDEPRLFWPEVRGEGLVIKRCGEIVDTDIFGIAHIWAIHHPLIGGTNPVGDAESVRFEGGDPLLVILSSPVSEEDWVDLRPAGLILSKSFRACVKITKVCHTLDFFCAGLHLRKHARPHHEQNADDEDNGD